MMGFFKKHKPLPSLAKSYSPSELRKRTKILVIDDDETAFPTEALVDEGYTVEYWPDIKSMDRLERGDFDIIVLDIAGVGRKFAPEEEGFGVLHHLKWHNPAQIVVAFSGQSFDLSKQEFFKLADDTMPKPVNILKCKQVLDQLIETKMTVNHMWSTVVVLMRAEGVPEKKIARMEKQVAASVAQGNRPDIEGIVNSAVDRSELAAKVAGVIVKIVGLCGL